MALLTVDAQRVPNTSHTAAGTWGRSDVAREPAANEVLNLRATDAAIVAGVADDTASKARHRGPQFGGRMLGGQAKA